jgi:aminomethyltransferase
MPTLHQLSDQWVGKTTAMRMNYGMLLNDDGGILDDLMAYFYHPEKILLVVNASNLEKDFAWIQEIHKRTNDQVVIADISSEVGQIAFKVNQLKHSFNKSLPSL